MAAGGGRDMTEAVLQPAAWIYDNRTTHVRLAPFQRRFTYRIMQIFVDIDRVGEAARGLKFFTYNRPGLFSFYDRDHGERSDRPLREWAERTFARAGIQLDGGAIRLLTFPRVLNYVFNPLSVYFGYGPEGELRGVIYEVNNTFGETHAYVAPAISAGGPTRHRAEKLFHVSPFFDVRGCYAFEVVPPGPHFRLSIENIADGERQHLATLAGERRPLRDAALISAFLSLPFMTLGVIAAIHWQALRLWLKGARYRSKPPPPAAASVAAELPSPGKIGY
jgi:DUF1365 family protein